MRTFAMILLVLAMFLLNACGRGNESGAVRIRLSSTTCSSELLVKFVSGKCEVYANVVPTMSDINYTLTPISGGVELQTTEDGTVWVEVL